MGGWAFGSQRGCFTKEEQDEDEEEEVETPGRVSEMRLQFCLGMITLVWEVSSRRLRFILEGGNTYSHFITTAGCREMAFLLGVKVLPSWGRWSV